MAKCGVCFRHCEIKEGETGFCGVRTCAGGRVIPANYGSFLAVLGDNKKETEVVSPLSTIKQAISEVINSNNGNKSMTVVLQLDGDVLFEKMVDLNDQNTLRTGVNAMAR